MSAFICNPDHIRELAIYAATSKHGSTRVDPSYIKGFENHWSKHSHELAQIYADVLHAENVRSVSYRYSEPANYENGVNTDKLPGLIERPETVPVSYEQYRKAGVRDPVVILSMVACLNYQSCETDDWQQTAAYNLLEGIKDAAIRALPGYGDVWEYAA